MAISVLSKKIFEVQKRNFAKSGSELTSELIFIHLAEEVGEIARQLFSKAAKMRKFDEANFKEEIAQAILDLMVLAELNGVELEKELEKKIWEISKREHRVS